MTNKQPNAIRKQHPDWEFPDFMTTVCREKKADYAVCVFVINEGARIQAQLRKMKKFATAADIIVVDGGSTDGSLEISFLKSCGVAALLTKTGPGKLSAQMRMAFAYALHQGYEGIITIDGNNKDDVSAIPDFIKLLGEGYDHVQGSRYIPGGKAINTPRLRHIGVKLLHAPLVSLASHRRHTDTTNGFRGYSRRLLMDSKIAPFRNIFQTYELHYHMAIESSRDKKYRLVETPVTRSYPKSGKVPSKISPLKGNIQILNILMRASLRAYRLK